MPGGKAPDLLRKKANRYDTRVTKGEGSAADGCFSSVRQA